MRSKTILSAAVFVLAFVLSAAFASLYIPQTQTELDVVLVSNYKPTSCFKERNKSATADKIVALIDEDESNGYRRNKQTYSIGADVRSPFTSDDFPEYAEAVEQYVDASSSMNTDDLPRDFQAAWREHMKAWRDKSNLLNRMKKSSNRDALSEEKFNNLAATRSREITRSWQEVLRIGRSYGANVY